MDKNIKLKPGDMVIWIPGKDENHKYTSFITNNYRTIKQFEAGDKVLKVLRPTGYRTVYETKKEILDQEEKEYLSAVIRPFKNRVLYIVKVYNLYNDYQQLLTIALKGDKFIQFPSFEKDTMYKGMIPNRYYTLKELRLE